MVRSLMNNHDPQTGAAALLVMAKRPHPGQTKSRLTPPFSAITAAELYEQFLLDVLELARSVPDVTPWIAFAPPKADGYFRELAPDFLRIPQIGSSLGERLDYVLTECLKKGYTYVAAMNSDSPSLPVAYLAMGFRQLANQGTDVVLGPCEDGGYYFIGWKRPHPQLVRGVEMSTDQVLEHTLAIAATQNLSVALLPAWYDVDDIADVQRLEKDLTANTGAGRHTLAYLLGETPARSYISSRTQGSDRQG